jgi:hypothetical protein
VSPITAPFRKVLGDALAQVPEPVRQLHTLSGSMQTAGRAEINAAANPAARFLCWFAGLPKPGSDIPVRVTFDSDGEGGEFWQRHFSDRRYASVMAAGAGSYAGLLVERFWPFTYCHRLSAGPEGIEWRLVRWRFLGLPLPRWTMPSIRCFESGDGDRYCFDINVVFPLIGPVIHYRGWLLPV